MNWYETPLPDSFEGIYSEFEKWWKTKWQMTSPNKISITMFVRFLLEIYKRMEKK